MSLSFLHRLVLAIILAGTFQSANADDATKSRAQPAGEQTAAECMITISLIRVIPFRHGYLPFHPYARVASPDRRRVLPRG